MRNKQYYLSNTPDTSFNKSKVGVSNEGPYIILEGFVTDKLFAVKVKLFSNTRIDYDYVYVINAQNQITEYHRTNYVLPVQ